MTRAKKFLKTLPLAMLSLAVLLTACAGEEIQGVCSSNSDCDSGFKCIEHQCLCQNDEACGEDEFCNGQGFCQKIIGCRTDADCGENFRCQMESSGKGNCLCVNDQACASDEYCNSSGSCQKKAGCILDSDCGDASDWFCRINQETKIGECFCKADGACEQGEFCNPKGYCQPLAVCTSNDDCPAGKLCDTDSGECLCDYANNAGCRSDEVCNASGYCQPRPGCYDNSDCEDVADSFCDLTTQTCIPKGTCTSDRQCPLGQICRQNACIAGCSQSYDCPLDECCVGNQCQPCNCQDDEFCAFAEYCQSGNCQTAYSQDTPYCKPCDGQSLDWNQCGGATNRCLIYPYENDPFTSGSGKTEYCAVDCSTNERCPSGFSCGDIVVIKPSDQCHSDADCPPGVPCWKSAEEDTGYCPCHATKNACPPDTCDTYGISGPPNTCVNKKTPCQTSADCVIECVSDRDDGFGGCSIGKNCGLIEGVHCPDPNTWP